MDTDDLSREAYEAVIIEAEKFHHDLTLQFGLLSYECNNEQEYLNQAVILIKELKKIGSYDLEEVFFDEMPEMPDFQLALNNILNNIERINQIPINKRHLR